MGLLDIFNTYEGQQGLGLLAAASARSDGAGFGQRLQEGLGMADNWKRKKAQDEFQQMQIADHMARIEEAKAQRAQQEKLRAGMAQFFKPGQQALSPLMGDASIGIQPSAGRAAVAPSFDTAGAAQFLAQSGEYEKAMSMMPKREQQINKLDVKDFTPASVAKFAQTQNYGDLVRMDKAHFANIGGQTVAADPFTGKPLNSIDNTQSPDSRAGNMVSMRGQDLVNARAKEANGIQQQASRTQVMQTPEGLIAIDKGTNSAMPVTMGGKPVRSEDSMKKTANAKTVISLLDEADKLIPNSTGSVIGYGVDAVVGATGYGTKGATAIGQLKTIEGQLIGNMPRMEGPQSDADRMLYQQAAGDIANAMKPREIRKAAVQTIRKLQERYAPGQSAGGIDSLLDKYK